MENSAKAIPSRPKKKSRSSRSFLMVLTVVPLGAVMVGLGVIAARVSGQGNGVPEGVSVGALHLGGKSKEEVRPLLEKMVQDRLNVPVELRLPAESHVKRIWKATANEIGLGIDMAATVEGILKTCNLTLMDRVRYAISLPKPQQFGFQTTFDETAVQKRLRRIARVVDREPKNPRLRSSTTPFTVIAGKPGLILDRSASKKAISAAWSAYILLPDGQLPQKLEVELPLKVEQPTISEASLREIDGTLGSFTTHFGGTGANRGNNIALAAGRIDGTLLAPGEVFSYNKVVGPRIASAGFKDAPVIIKGELVPGIGGGICQVSTTLYNAALLANLKIVSRSHHAFPVHYVRPGRDATVVDGAIDFKFENNTGTPIYIQASSGGGRLSFTILGKRVEGRSVSIELADHTTIPIGESVVKKDPTLPTGKRVVKDKGHIGHRVTVYRVVKEGGEVSKREVIARDYYKPFPAIILEGTAPKPITPKADRSAPLPPNGAEPDATETNSTPRDPANSDPTSSEPQ
jgi:vancomycin resistance protein YoaR